MPIKVKAAEIYYNGGVANAYGPSGNGASGTVTNTGPLAGLVGACADSDVTKLLKASANQAGNTATCMVGYNGASYMAYVTLNNPSTTGYVFCVDSSNNSGEVASSGLVSTLTSGSVACKP